MTTEAPTPDLTAEPPEYADPLAEQRGSLAALIADFAATMDDARAYRAQLEDNVRAAINELAAIEAGYDDAAKRHREELSELARRRSGLGDSLRAALAAIPEPTAPTT